MSRRADREQHRTVHRPKEVPPGATRRAFDREPNGGGDWSPPGDRHAAGTPGGGSEVGGLGGTTIGEGAPENADLEETMGTGENEYNEEFEGPPYGGISGGAVGGTPAQGRSSGGRTHRGIAPGGVHRGDSTIGSDPDRPTE